MPVVDVGVGEVGEDTALGCFLDELGVPGVDQDDYRAGGFSDDLVDQLECVLRALAEPDERDVGSLSGGHGGHVFDLDLAGDHLVSERDHGRRDEREPVLALVGDQDAQMLGVPVAHERFYPGESSFQRTPAGYMITTERQI